MKKILTRVAFNALLIGAGAAAGWCASHRRIDVIIDDTTSEVTRQLREEFDEEYVRDIAKIRKESSITIEEISAAADRDIQRHKDAHEAKTKELVDAHLKQTDAMQERISSIRNESWQEFEKQHKGELGQLEEQIGKEHAEEIEKLKNEHAAMLEKVCQEMIQKYEKELRLSQDLRKNKERELTLKHQREQRELKEKHDKEIDHIRAELADTIKNLSDEKEAAHAHAASAEGALSEAEENNKRLLAEHEGAVNRARAQAYQQGLKDAQEAAANEVRKIQNNT